MRKLTSTEEREIRDHVRSAWRQVDAALKLLDQDENHACPIGTTCPVCAPLRTVHRELKGVWERETKSARQARRGPELLAKRFRLGGG